LWLHSLNVAQLLRSAAFLHTNQSRSYLNHLVYSTVVKRHQSRCPVSPKHPPPFPAPKSMVLAIISNYRWILSSAAVPIHFPNFWGRKNESRTLYNILHWYDYSASHAITGQAGVSRNTAGILPFINPSLCCVRDIRYRFLFCASVCVFVCGSVLLTKYYLGDRIEMNVMGGACSTYGKRRGAYRVSLGKSEGKGPSGRPRCR